MAVSRRVRYEWRCATCGHAQEAPVWRILDIRERGDLIEEPGLGLAEVICGNCGAGADVDAPLLIIRPNHSLPLLLGLSLEALADPDPWRRELASEALKALGGDAGGINGPIIPLPRRLLPLVLARDVSSDMKNPDQAIREVSASDATLSNMYGRFLQILHDTEQERKLISALQELWSVPPDRLPVFLAEHPELGSSDAVSVARAELDNFQGVSPEHTKFGRVSSDESDALLRARLALVEGLASGRPADEVAREYITGLERFGAQVNSDFAVLLAEVEASPETVDIRRVRQARQMAFDLHYEDAESSLNAALASRLLELPRTSSGEIEEVISLLRRSLTLVAEDDPRYLDMVVNLASAYNRRLVGDVIANWETKRELLERAIAICDSAAEAWKWAVIQTNYGLLLAERPGGSQQDLKRGIEHILAGLEERSPALDVVDWTYSQLNLGLLYSRSKDAGDLDRARHCYEEALTHLRPDHDVVLWTTLQNNLADLLLDTDPSDLDAAELAARSALEFASAIDDPLTTGRYLWMLARVIERRNGPLSAEALRLRREAFDALDPRIAPDLVLTIGGELFEAYPRLGDWSALADVANSQLAAFSTLYNAQTTAEGQRTVLASSSLLARWCAYVLARAGRFTEAVEAIEHGRTRQLAVAVGRDTADLASLAAVDEHLANRYRAAMDAYRAALEGTGAQASSPGISGQESAAAEQDMQRLLAEIRDIPGFDRFLQAMSITDIARVANPHPLMYLVCAPWGSYALIVRSSPADEPIVDAIAVSEVTSSSVAHLVTVAPDGTPGLLPAQVIDPKRLVPVVLERLNEITPLAKPIADVLTSEPDQVPVVVPTGLLGLVPLAAIPVPGATGQVLDDIGEIHLAPSAAVYAACRKRASRPALQEKLVGIADPDGTPPPLPGSRAELATIQDLFRATGPTSCAFGPDATRPWALAQIPGASHIHFSCHGFSEFNNEVGGSLLLAGGEQLNIKDLIDGRLSGCRLATASACQSGHYTTSSPPDEFTGLPAGFIQAGAACAIVSLWQVYDDATALLMTRFYELHHPGPSNASSQPATALRNARTWLRNLTSEEAGEYIRAHPHLAKSMSRRYVSPSSGTSTKSPVLPYSSPQDWAAFITWGC